MSVCVKKMTVGPLEENCYIVYGDGQNAADCVIVDPGAGGARIVSALKALNQTPAAILLTHGHFDHVMAVEWIRKEFPSAKVYACEKEREVIESPQKSLLEHFSGDCAPEAVNYLEPDAEYEFSGIRMRLIATPGHTAGSSCWYLEQDGILFSGDTLFRESVGRTDFPTGDDAQLRRSITERLKVLPPDTKVYPGHGEETTIGHERKYNFVMLGF